jgi:hypothetical protein
MLTWDDLEALLRAGKLKLWDPKRLGKVPPDGRALYMLPDVFEAVLDKPWPSAGRGEPAARTRERRSYMRRVLERYVTGGIINLNSDLAEMGSKLPKPHHRGWWEFRSQGPSVQTRLFGFFARRGAFVATGFRSKEMLSYKDQFAADASEWATLAGGAPYLDTIYPVDSPDHLEFYLTRETDD